MSRLCQKIQIHCLLFTKQSSAADWISFLGIRLALGLRVTWNSSWSTSAADKMAECCLQPQKQHTALKRRFLLWMKWIQGTTTFICFEETLGKKKSRINSCSGMRWKIVWYYVPPSLLHWSLVNFSGERKKFLTHENQTKVVSLSQDEFVFVGLWTSMLLQSLSKTHYIFFCHEPFVHLHVRCNVMCRFVCVCTDWSAASRW